ncbi:hypothetical protein HRR83_003024 [Exophiala dermatitidis]|uniref:Uncharacterized protein n=2 Tax=Exophiala dermatitidis TaxID=5970 RepID=H6BYG8_EXODN|nr:uncharacterized protein HMPREF1120_05579 [Exophiala dermatitidis NIH/UT8656]KAJ4506752.1 hypothetical protein HRR73_007967 [Exophiala dermatitidis]EHY57548.1 hypothetical protein HMPREF1120_05579 [Exophiala dermatitidis NIH/UT8656]KAJ4520545.1 hypothetical protein HRR74_003543 [Exophiala dermatitidis]KAJ4537818.1 hypothetical protein HRR76_005802 [Exophiala dermatitidis]KAJ4551518.1 hypothetical protein HRR77_002756 [Exophiala dermatitidis]
MHSISTDHQSLGQTLTPEAFHSRILPPPPSSSSSSLEFATLFSCPESPKAVKIDPPTSQGRVFALDLSPPVSPRPLSPRSHRSHPVPIRELPGSSSLLSGPRLSPPPPIRFRAINPFTHHRTASAPISLQNFATAPPSRRVSHNRAKSLPSFSGQGPTTSDPLSHGSTELCNSHHRDLPVRGPGVGGLRNLCHSEQSQSVRQKREGTGRRRITRSVRFALDEENPVALADETERRSVSGLLRSEDDGDTWF